MSYGDALTNGTIHLLTQFYFLVRFQRKITIDLEKHTHEHSFENTVQRRTRRS